MNKLAKTTLLGAATLAFSALAVHASNNDALLDLLVKKGVLSNSEAAAVQAELATQKAPLAVKAKGKETVELRFNGRMHFQYDSLDAEHNGNDLASTNHFYFRRLRLGAKAKHTNGLFAETVVDFAGNDLSVDKAVAGYKFSDALTGSFGYQKVPFGFQETTSSSKIKTIERSAANRFFADDIDFAGRHTGLHAKGSLGNGFSYAAAVVNAAQGEGSKLLGASNADNDMAAFGRLQWKQDDLTLGLDAGQQSNNSVKSLTKGGELDPNKPRFDVSAYTAYVNYDFDNFDILGEYFNGDLGDKGDVDGYSVRVAYAMDKFEPVFRYSHLESDGFEIDTDELIRRAPATKVTGPGELDSYYFGVNYYHNKAVSLMLGYEIAEADNDAGAEDEIEGFRSRVQILW
jgi:phosphate-selective porin